MGYSVKFNLFIFFIFCFFEKLYCESDGYQQHIDHSSFQKSLNNFNRNWNQNLDQQKVLDFKFKKPITRDYEKIEISKETVFNKKDPIKLTKNEHVDFQNSILDFNINRIKEMNKLNEENKDKDIENYSFGFQIKSKDFFDKKNEIEREFIPAIKPPTKAIIFNDSFIAGLPDISNCPVCFKLVKNLVIEEYEMLKKLIDQLEFIKNYPEVIQDLSFQFRLRELASLVDNLLKDARFANNDEQNILKNILDLKERIQKLTIIRDQITQLPEIERFLSYSSSNMSIIDEIIKQIQSGVDNSRKFLDNQGSLALKKAWERSSKFGLQSERLSQIARESRHLADEHYIDSAEVYKLATKSLNTSQIAFRLAKDAVSTQEGYKNAMEKLRKQWASTQSLVMKIAKIADEAHKESLKAYNEALDIYSKSSVSLPTSNSERINQDVVWVMNQAMQMMAEIDNLLEKYEVTIHGNQNKLSQTFKLLEQAQNLQSITNGLLRETQEGYNKALSAFESGELTLKDAQNTLKILKEFDNLVSKTKSKAEEALKKVEEIHNLIKEAELKTEDAEKALKGSLKDALEAKELALEAQRIAEKASSQVRKFKEQAFMIKNKGSDLKKKVDLFNLKIEECFARITQSENEGENDGKQVKDILEKANNAKNLANEAMTKIENAINSLNSILDELKNLQQIDPSLLEELFQRLAKAEQEYKEADLDNRTKILNEAKDLQRIWIVDYERLISKLQSDVNNIDKIRQAIPDKCFRRLRLEP